MGQILLISHDQEQAHAAALAERVLHNAGSAEPPPRIKPLAARELLVSGAVPAATSIAWLYAGSALSRAERYALLDTLAEHAIPTLVSLGDPAFQPGTLIAEGAVAAPPDDQPDEIYRMLQAVRCGGEAASNARTELALARRQQSGISGQMDRLDEELRLASKLQRQFLPPTLPSLASLRFEVLFQPAGYVSGDIYDVQCLDRHHSAFYVADAVGHGVPAALLTMFIKQALQPRDVYGSEPRILRPDEAISRLNRDMCLRQHGPTQFATACYGLLDIRNNELLLARAGHPPPILVRHNGDVELLQPDGALLGVFEDETYELLRTRVEPGDRLLIYSDGFEFAFGSDGAHMVSDYTQELRRLCQGPIDQVVARLRHRLDQQAGSLHQQDDLTVLLADLTPDPAADPDNTANAPQRTATL